MATQHPDNAFKPYWNSRPFVSTAAEIKECYSCFSELGIDEYNWDWEGKFVDEAVVDRLLHTYFSYFKKNPLGEKKFLTFRIPNPRLEKQFRLARAFMVAITNSQLMSSLGFSSHPIFEAILPLTETAKEIVEIQQAFRELVRIDHKLLHMEDSIQHMEMIPLFEQVGKIIESGQIVRKYIKMHLKLFGNKPSYIRPYCARSDPALNSGLVPTILAIKVALSDYERIEKEFELRLYPMLGTGSLPFRGGVSPEYISQSVHEYQGVRTLTLQSAFRYDYPKAHVKEAVEYLSRELPRKKAMNISKKIRETIINCIPYFEDPYRDSVEKLAPFINQMSKEFPKRRERLQHIGLFGYSRGIGNVRLPRAIPFTGSLYSLGLPPEIIGTGRGIKQAKADGLWEQIAPVYINMKSDMVRAGYFLNKENVLRLGKKLSGWYDVMDDISEIEKEFGIELGPKDSHHVKHHELTQKTLENVLENKKVTLYINETGLLRKSLG